MKYSIFQDKNIEPSELSSLFEEIGWGSYPDEIIIKSISAYPFIAYARSESGVLIGYLSAFSDRVFSTMLGELVVHSKFRRRGVARMLLESLDMQYPDCPIYVQTLGESKHFFFACGYKYSSSEVCALYKK